MEQSQAIDRGLPLPTGRSALYLASLLAFLMLLGPGSAHRVIPYGQGEDVGGAPPTPAGEDLILRSVPRGVPCIPPAPRCRGRNALCCRNYWDACLLHCMHQCGPRGKGCYPACLTFLSRCVEGKS